MNSEQKNKPVLQLKDIKKSFGDNHVLKGFNLELYEGENLVIMGKSGSGKSVMVKCIVGLIQPDSGSITIKDKNIITMGQAERSEEHTSELQSRGHLVCRLLLEK